jgi:hypothetical protein
MMEQTNDSGAFDEEEFQKIFGSSEQSEDENEHNSERIENVSTQEATGS